MDRTMINPSALPDGSISENHLDAALKSVITNKQDVIVDLDAIRAGAAKGATALQTHQSLAAYAKTVDVNAALTEKQDIIEDLDAIRAGAAKGATALQTHQSLAAYAKTVDVNTALTEKQDVIEDLDDIRAGAAKGATALQEHQDLGAYATTEAMTEAIQNEKQQRVDETAVLGQGLDELDERTQDIAAELAQKQDALTLTVKDNGNIVLSNIQGQSKEFMPATPTGDPLHWAYVKRGAEYNDTGADIIKTAPWADLADDDADKTVVHKAGRWYLNGIGDLTTEEIRNIYCTYQSYFELTGRQIDYLLSQCVARTFFAKIGYWHTFTRYFQNLLYSSNIIVLPLYGLHSNGNMTNNATASNMSYMCYGSGVQHILGDLSIFNSTNVNNSFRTATLKTLKLKGIASNISFELCSQLTLKSILYMIQNEAAKSAITITLHADVYAKAMKDESILAALAEHTNVSLASA